MPAELPLVEARGVGVRRGGRWLLRDVDIKVARREVVTLIGPNGAGKTTLVRVLLGLLGADTGEVRREEGVTVGYVPQRVQFDPTLPLTVARLMTLTSRRPIDAVTEALDETGVGHLLGARVSDLSSGELQRVLLARALMRLPNLLVLDEPLQGVDYTGETELYDLIAAIVDRRGCGVLMVSHDLHIVMAATDRVVCLNHHVCCTGAPAEVVGHDEFRRLFGPRTAAGAAVYRHVHDHVHDLAGDVADGDDRGTHAGAG
ncbi:MAG: ATP-binding cassette domain-containing protein [Immundisolibacterales bacterium]|nr:ATP-binding cassette domain-containing protein [Immundisolibacterales bacterium]